MFDEKTTTCAGIGSSIMLHRNKIGLTDLRRDRRVAAQSRLQMTTTQTPSQAKTETPTNPFLAFDPFAAWTQSQQAFHKMMADALGRAQAFGEQYAALENQAVIRAQGAI